MSMNMLTFLKYDSKIKCMTYTYSKYFDVGNN